MNSNVHERGSPEQKPFAAITEAVCRAIQSVGAEALLIGGHAVNHYGYTRSTLDLDLMTASSRWEELVGAMRQEGFVNIERLENVVFLRRTDNPIRVDLLRVDDQTMQQLLPHAVDVRYQGHRLKIPALNDLLAMKLFALKHNWARRVHKDLPDIAHLVAANGVDIERILKPLCLRFADATTYGKILDEIALIRPA